MRHLAVPKPDRPVTTRHSGKLLADAGRLADHVEQHFGLRALEHGARVVLLVALVGRIGFRGELIDP